MKFIIAKGLEYTEVQEIPLEKLKDTKEIKRLTNRHTLIKKLN